MVQEQQVIPIQTNGHKCKFGHFYHSIEISHPDIKMTGKIDSIHNNLHNLAHDIINAIEQKNQNLCIRTLKNAEQMSGEIIKILNSIIEKVKEMDQQGINVF